MEQTETQIYYPGDMLRLRVEIEHLANFTRMEAMFRGRPEAEAAGTEHLGTTMGLG